MEHRSEFIAFAKNLKASVTEIALNNNQIRITRHYIY